MAINCRPIKYKVFKSSSVSLCGGSTALPSDEVENSCEILHGSETAGATFDGVEHTVEPLHEGLDDPAITVGQDPREVRLH